MASNNMPRVEKAALAVIEEGEWCAKGSMPTAQAAATNKVFHDPPPGHSAGRNKAKRHD